jgi:hypothetical protein
MVVSGPKQSMVVQKIHEALGVRLFTPPPEGFDPLRASDRELLVHGYPARPDVQLSPDLHERWNQMMSRPMSLIEPQFAVTPDRRHGPWQRFAAPADNWSGSVAYPGPNDQVTFVSGQWTVPAVAIPAPGSVFYACGTWIGIDGGPTGGIGPGPALDVLQAGTAQEIASSVFGPLSSTYAWFEWFPEDPVTITNLHARPGDVIFCEISVHSPTEAGIFMWNVTTRFATSFVKTAPQNIQVVGNTVEWILEVPTINDHFAMLPEYGEVYFDQCIASSRNHKLLLGGQARLISMHDVNGQTISTPNAVTAQLITTRYTALP